MPSYHCDPCTDARRHDADHDDARRRHHRRPDRAGQLRADAPARALRQGRHEGRPAVPRGEAGHRRPRAVEQAAASSTARRRRRRTSSRRATRSATGGPARSRARTRSAASGAARPTAATSRRSPRASSRSRRAASSQLAQRDRARPVGDRLQEARGRAPAPAPQRRSSRRRRAPRRWASASARSARSRCIGARRRCVAAEAVTCSASRSIASCSLACGGQESQAAPRARTGRAVADRRCRARASSRRAWSRSIARRRAARRRHDRHACCPTSTAARRCHPDAAAQWSASAHSFASFGNPIYRVERRARAHELGKHDEPALRRLSRHAADGRRPDDRPTRSRPPICARTPA